MGANRENQADGSGPPQLLLKTNLGPVLVNETLGLDNSRLEFIDRPLFVDFRLVLDHLRPGPKPQRGNRLDLLVARACFEITV